MSRLAGALLGLVLLAGCSSGPDAVDVNNGGEFRFVAGTPSGEAIPPEERASAPDFSGELLDGAAFSSEQLAGQVAVLNFWGSWCAPCRVETPEVSEVALACRDYPANAIPSTIVLDPEGGVAAVYTGEVSQDDLRRVLGRVLEEADRG